MIQICGLASSCKQAPIVDEAWGLPWSPLSHRYSVWFELHDRSLWERRGEAYVQSLRDSEVPIYMQRVEPDIPMSREYPLHEVVECIGADYFNSSIAYMVGLAILQGRDVELWGVDCHVYEEWAFERPCNEYLIGVARGKGLKVWVHPNSSLLRFTPDILYMNERQYYRGRYGWLKEAR